MSYVSYADFLGLFSALSWSQRSLAQAPARRTVTTPAAPGLISPAPASTSHPEIARRSSSASKQTSVTARGNTGTTAIPYVNVRRANEASASGILPVNRRPDTMLGVPSSSTAVSESRLLQQSARNSAANQEVVRRADNAINAYSSTTTGYQALQPMPQSLPQALQPSFQPGGRRLNPIPIAPYRTDTLSAGGRRFACSADTAEVLDRANQAIAIFE